MFIRPSGFYIGAVGSRRLSAHQIRTSWPRCLPKACSIAPSFNPALLTHAPFFSVFRKFLPELLHFALAKGTQSNDHSLDLLNGDLAIPLVVERRSSRRLMPGHRLGNLEEAAVLQISRDSRRTEGMAAYGRFDTGIASASSDHAVDVGPTHRP